MLTLLIAGQRVNVTNAQAKVIATLNDAKAGGFASIHGYRPSTGVIDQPVYDVRILTRFSTERLYARRIAALKAIKFEDVTLDHPKLVELSEADQRELFDTRLNGAIASMEKTLTGDRSDAHRAGHDRCYVKIAQGVTGHLLTEKGPDSLKYPVLNDDGHATLESIMIEALEISRTVRVEGSYKVVNSGPAVLMSNAINKLLNSRSVDLKRFSLKANNFDDMTISRENLKAHPQLAQLVAA